MKAVTTALTFTVWPSKGEASPLPWMAEMRVMEGAAPVVKLSVLMAQLLLARSFTGVPTTRR
ncbi:hypothetical protein SDC9_169867 [bioreactor metagenome]|uniref:Uncharacterized protein n=1 Tax=bioreactor metagenome TaxID=1076179 RepID=A0A645GER6_9ZZZZ